MASPDRAYTTSICVSRVILTSRTVCVSQVYAEAFNLLNHRIALGVAQTGFTYVAPSGSATNCPTSHTNTCIAPNVTTPAFGQINSTSGRSMARVRCSSLPSCSSKPHAIAAHTAMPSRTAPDHSGAVFFVPRIFFKTSASPASPNRGDPNSRERKDVPCCDRSRKPGC